MKANDFYKANFNYLKGSLFVFLLTLCAFSGASQVLINEYSCANLNQFIDDHQDYGDWIEIVNTTTSLVNLTGYHLTDNPDIPDKWQLPDNATITPSGYMRFWCSGRNTGLHTNFQLSQTKSNAEVIVLSDAAGVVLDTVEIKKTQLGHSRGRTPNGADTWAIFKAPSPGSTNNNAFPYLSYADRPDFSMDAGFYTDAVTVSITNNAPNSIIYYSIDGTAPVDTSPVLIDTFFTFTTTKVLKARAYSQDTAILPSFIEFKTYFVNDVHTLPVVSISGTRLNNLANGNQNLKPYGSCEYFNLAGERTAKSYGEFNSHGQDSWVNDQRSIDLVCRDEMGYSAAINEKLYRFTDRDKFQRIIFRAAGDDNYPDGSTMVGGGAHMRDAYIHNLVKRGNMSCDVRVSEKAILYINGIYWGVYDIREKPDDHDYTGYNYDQGKFDLQYIQTWGNTWAQYGGDPALAAWDTLHDYILASNMSVAANYQYVTDRLDVKSLVDYVLTNSITVCSDWLNYNTGWWRGLNPEGTHKKWGYIIWDNDATFGYYINYTGVDDTTATAAPCQVEDLTSNWSDPEDHITILNKLRTNAEFNQYYVTRYADLMNTVFSCDNMLMYFDSIYNTIQPEMTRHIERWGGTTDGWQFNVNRLRNYITNRCNFLGTGIADCYDLTGPYPVTFTVDPLDIASMDINSLTINQFPYTGQYFEGIPTLLKTYAYDTTAFVFDAWTSNNGMTFSPDSLNISNLAVTGQDTITAHFNILSAVKDPAILRAKLSAYPNAVQNITTIEYELPTAAPVRLMLYNAVGQPIATLLQSSQNMPQGRYTFSLNLASAGIPAGIYIVQLDAADYHQSIKLSYQP